MSLSRPPLPLRVIKETWASPVVPFYKPGGVPLFSKHQLEAVKTSARNTSVALNKKGTVLPTDALESVFGPSGYNTTDDLEDSVQNRLSDSLPESAPLPFVAFPLTIQPSAPLPLVGGGSGSSISGLAAHGFGGNDSSSSHNSNEGPNNNNSTNSASGSTTAREREAGISSFRQAAKPFETSGRYSFFSDSNRSLSTFNSSPTTFAVEHAVPNVPTWFASGNGHFQKGVSIGVASSALRGFYATAARHKGIVSTYHVLCQVVPNDTSVLARSESGEHGDKKLNSGSEALRVFGPDKAKIGGGFSARGRGLPSVKMGASRGVTIAKRGDDDAACEPPSGFLPWSPLLEGQLLERNRLLSAGHVRMATVPLSFIVGDNAVGEAMRELCQKELAMSSLFMRREEESGEVLRRIPLVSLDGISSGGSSNPNNTTSVFKYRNPLLSAMHWTLRRPHPFLLPEQMVALQPLDNPLLSGAASSTTSNVKLVARTRAAVARKLREYARNGTFDYKLLHYNPNTALALLEVTTSSLDEHQIRVALANSGLPVVGDFVYREDLARAIVRAHHGLHSRTFVDFTRERSAGNNGMKKSAESDHSTLSFASVAEVMAGSAKPNSNSPSLNPFVASPLSSIAKPLGMLPSLWRKLSECVKEEIRVRHHQDLTRRQQMHNGRSPATTGPRVAADPPDTFLVVESVLEVLLGLNNDTNAKSHGRAVNANKERGRRRNGRADGLYDDEAASLEEGYAEDTSGEAKGAPRSLVPQQSAESSTKDISTTRTIVSSILEGTSALSTRALSARRRQGGGGDENGSTNSAVTIANEVSTGTAVNSVIEDRFVWTTQQTRQLRQGVLALLSAAKSDADLDLEMKSVEGNRGGGNTSSHRNDTLSLPLVASLALGPCISLSALLYPSSDSAYNAIILEDVDVGDQLLRLSRSGGESGSADIFTADTSSGGSKTGANVASSPLIQRLSMSEAKTDVPMTFQVSLKQKPVPLALRHPLSIPPCPPSALFAASSLCAAGHSAAVSTLSTSYVAGDERVTGSSGGRGQPDRCSQESQLVSSQGGNDGEGKTLARAVAATKQMLYVLASMVEGGLGSEELGELLCPSCLVSGHTLRTCPKQFDVGSLRRLVGDGREHQSQKLLALSSESVTISASDIGAAVETQYFADKSLVAKQSVLGASMSEGMRARGVMAARGDGGGISDAIAGVGGGPSALRFVENKTPSVLAWREKVAGSVPAFHRDGSSGLSSSSRVTCQYCHGLHSVTECPKLGLSSASLQTTGNTDEQMIGANGKPKQKVCPTSFKERFDTSCFDDVEAGETSALFCIRCGKHSHYYTDCPTLPRNFDSNTHCAVCLQRTNVVAHYSHQCSRRVKPPVGGYEAYHSCGVALKYFRTVSSSTNPLHEEHEERFDKASERLAHHKSAEDGEREAIDRNSHRHSGSHGGRAGGRSVNKRGWAMYGSGHHDEEHDSDLRKMNRGRSDRSKQRAAGRSTLFTEI